MALIGRRELLQSSSLALVAPVRAGWSARPDLARNDRAQPTALRVPPISTPLFAYVTDGLAQALATHRQIGAHPQNFGKAALKLKLLGHHFNETGFNDATRFLATQLDLRTVDLRNPPGIRRGVEIMRRYDPTFSKDDALIPTTIDDAAVRTVAADIAANGPSAHMFMMADGLKAAARQLANGTLAARRQPNGPWLAESRAYSDVRLTQAAFHLETAYRRDTSSATATSAMFCSSDEHNWSKQKFCHLLSYGLYFSSILAFVWSQVVCTTVDLTTLGLTAPVIPIVHEICSGFTAGVTNSALLWAGGKMMETVCLGE
jgi:hypothetical protein